MAVRTLIFCVIAAAILVNCALYGPTYKKTPVNAPQQWSSKDVLSYSSSIDLPMIMWWEKFDDPSLSYLIETALKRNNTIQMAVGQCIAAQGQLEQIQFAWLPTASGVFGNSTTSDSLLPFGHNLGFTPSFSLNIFQWMRSKEFAEASLEQVNAAKDAVRLTIISQTAGGYFSYLGQSYLLGLQQELVDDTKALYDLSKIQYEKGLISLYTLQQYEQQWKKAEAQLPILQTNVVVARNALKLLLNENPGELPINSIFMRVKSNGIIPVDLPSHVLKNRPDVREAEEELIAANAQIGVATSIFFPTISLTGALGVSSSQLSDLVSEGTTYWNHQASITQPLLDAPAFGQIKAAKGAYYTANYNYIQTVRTAFEAVDNDLSAHDRYMASYHDQIQNNASAKEAYDLAKISYKKGLYSYPTLLINKINWDNAKINLAEAKLAQLNTVVQLYQDLGGGYRAKGD